MTQLNYVGGIVKILELPKIKLNKQKILFTQFKVQLPQRRKKRANSIAIIIVGKYLAEDIVKYYHVNDYILVEGFISLKKIKVNSKKRNKFKYFQINVRKVFPFFLN